MGEIEDIKSNTSRIINLERRTREMTPKLCERFQNIRNREPFQIRLKRTIMIYSGKARQFESMDL
jgi:hypothetical protein